MKTVPCFFLIWVTFHGLLQIVWLYRKDFGTTSKLIQSPFVMNTYSFLLRLCFLLSCRCITRVPARPAEGHGTNKHLLSKRFIGHVIQHRENGSLLEKPWFCLLILDKFFEYLFLQIFTFFSFALNDVHTQHFAKVTSRFSIWCYQ